MPTRVVSSGNVASAASSAADDLRCMTSKCGITLTWGTKRRPVGRSDFACAPQGAQSARAIAPALQPASAAPADARPRSPPTPRYRAGCRRGRAGCHPTDRSARHRDLRGKLGVFGVRPSPHVDDDLLDAETIGLRLAPSRASGRATSGLQVPPRSRAARTAAPDRRSGTFDLGHHRQSTHPTRPARSARGHRVSAQLTPFGPSCTSTPHPSIRRESHRSRPTASRRARARKPSNSST